MESRGRAYGSIHAHPLANLAGTLPACILVASSAAAIPVELLNIVEAGVELAVASLQQAAESKGVTFGFAHAS